MADGARFESAQDALTYILSGHAVVTLVSRRTGARFTYRIAAPTPAPDDGEPSRIRFVSVLTGPDNGRNYSYLGQIYTRGGAYVKGVKSSIVASAPSASAFAWSWRKLSAGVMPEDLEVWHEGACGRCGRRLTDPASIACGLGPECRRAVGAVAQSALRYEDYKSEMKGELRK